MATRLLLLAAVLVVFSGSVAQRVSAQGIVVPGVGPINRSMAGAAVAAPIDAAGAMHWNPAAISGLESSQMLFGAEFLLVTTELASSVLANTLGEGVPPVDLSGSNVSQCGVNVLPTFALVHQPEDSAWTYGLGLFTIGGFGTNYPANPQNPVLSPPLPNGIGLGPVFSYFSLVQIAPTVAVQLTPRVSLGFAPTFCAGSLSLSPGSFASPDDEDNDGFPTYPEATHDRLRWGLGFQAGIYFVANPVWSFGASFKSPQWLEDFEFNSADEIGAPRTLTLDADYPMIISLGAAYRGLHRTLVAVDVRYIDYENTDGLGDPAGFDATGAVTGFGWESVVSVSLGIQYELTCRTAVRTGYFYADSPIPDEVTSLNVCAPTIYKHAIFVGSSTRLTDRLTFSWAYYHTFPTSVRGQYLTPYGAVPGSSVNISQSIDALVAGVHIDY